MSIERFRPKSTTPSRLAEDNRNPYKGKDGKEYYSLDTLLTANKEYLRRYEATKGPTRMRQDEEAQKAAPNRDKILKPIKLPK